MDKSKQIQDFFERLSHLEHENYILLEQVKTKDSILKVLLDELDLIFGSVSPDRTIEFIKGRGLDSFNVQPIDILGRSIDDALTSVPPLKKIIESAVKGTHQKEMIDLGFSKVYTFSSYPQFDEKGTLLRVFFLAY